MEQEAKDLIDKEISNNEVCLFMKGTPDAPQCGFSMAVSNMLKILEVNFKGVNVLEDEKLIKLVGIDSLSNDLRIKTSTGISIYKKLCKLSLALNYEWVFIKVCSPNNWVNCLNELTN